MNQCKLKKNVDINEQDEAGLTVLHFAVDLGKVQFNNFFLGLASMFYRLTDILVTSVYTILSSEMPRPLSLLLHLFSDRTGENSP